MMNREPDEISNRDVGDAAMGEYFVFKELGGRIDEFE